MRCKKLAPGACRGAEAGPGLTKQSIYSGWGPVNQVALEAQLDFFGAHSDS